jgi:hypothetical protein
VTRAGSKIDKVTVAQNVIIMKNPKTCIAVLLYIGYIMAKAKEPTVM